MSTKSTSKTKKKVEVSPERQFGDLMIKEVLDLGLILRYLPNSDDIQITLVGVDKYALPALLRKAAQKAEAELGL